jgi:5-methylthioadenosine/S-adenosylhomocysteine deaminase
MSLLIRNAAIVTMDDAFSVIEPGAVSVRDGRIRSVGSEPREPHDRVIDAGGDWLLPGFVQTHIHFCQTLFRGYADDLRLMDWLRRRIWPMEAAHTVPSLRAAARLAVAELLQTGTTSVLTMETVHDTDAVCDAVVGTGIRATIGKCMMDADDEVPLRLREATQSSIDDSLALRARWHGTGNGRLRIAFAPRFAVSCSRELLEAVAQLSTEHGALVHTHASESRNEVALVRERTGFDNVPYLAEVGLASPRLCAAHCVWVDDVAQHLLAERHVNVLHCPGSNLKLGSGIAPVPELRARGVCVSLGADGAACNNRLDIFDEMRLAGLIQSLRRAPGAVTARDVVRMATREGARALGLDDEIGSIEVGKRADLVLVRRDRPHMSPGVDPYSTLVYATRGSDVRATIVDGALLVDEGRLVREDPIEIATVARQEAKALASRAGF